MRTTILLVHLSCKVTQHACTRATQRNNYYMVITHILITFNYPCTVVGVVVVIYNTLLVYCLQVRCIPGGPCVRVYRLLQHIVTTQNMCITYAGLHTIAVSFVNFFVIDRCFTSTERCITNTNSNILQKVLALYLIVIITCTYCYGLGLLQYGQCKRFYVVVCGHVNYSSTSISEDILLLCYTVYIIHFFVFVYVQCLPTPVERCILIMYICCVP